jgi:glucose/mannose transport system permease protein
MAVASTDNAIRSSNVTRVFVYLFLLLFALFYLLPLGIMLINSLKPLDEITGGGMVALPRNWTIEPWLSAWSTAQIGVEPTGLRPYFMNSIMMAVPAVILSTIVGALNGYVLTKWQFRGATFVFGLLLFSCFIPFQIVLIPMARILGILQIAGTTPGLILVHFVYGIGFTTLYFRNYYAAFPTELVRAAQIDGAGFSRSSGASCCRPRGRSSRSASSGSSPTSGTTSSSARPSQAAMPRPMTVALNNLVNSSTGVREYNVHFAGAIMAAAPTLLVYIVAGRYFVRGLMAGSVKG